MKTPEEEAELLYAHTEFKDYITKVTQIQADARRQGMLDAADWASKVGWETAALTIREQATQ